MGAEFEALFVAVADPAATAELLAEVLGLDSQPLDDGQRHVAGLGVYVVLEPTIEAGPPGAATVWLRTDDAAALHDRCVAAGCTSIAAAHTSGSETVASVATPQGLRLGFISGRTDAGRSAHGA